MISHDKPNQCKKLKGSLQLYDWGKKGNQSLVAQLAKSSNVLDSVNPTQSFAELWFGSHPAGPSLSEGTPFTEPLPFLLKVLSVGKALSIQAHPNQSLAKDCHAKFPSIYKDPNHKPEMAIALSHFEALVGYKSQQEINDTLTKFPVLQKLTNCSQIHDNEEFITAIGNLLSSNPSTADFASIKESDQKPSQLYHKLQSQYPNDVGCFFSLLLNHFDLAPGEAIFLAPNEPHAYLEGDCVECMANSDNVVRAGLTGKFRDVELFLTMQREKILGQKNNNQSQQHFKVETREENGWILYETPVQEFYLSKYTFSSADSMISFDNNSQSILLVTKGFIIAKNLQAEYEVKCGEALYIPSGINLQIFATDTTIFKATSKI